MPHYEFKHVPDTPLTRVYIDGVYAQEFTSLYAAKCWVKFKQAGKSVEHETLAMNEPEALVENLRRMCERKAGETGSYSDQGGFSLMTDDERRRWRRAAEALAEVVLRLRRHAPSMREGSLK